MTSPTDLILEEATEADIPTLAEINALCYIPQAISAFFFTDWPNIATATVYFAARVAERMRDPKTQVIKLLEAQSRKTIGFVCLSLSDHEDARIDVKNPGGDFSPEIDSNLEFAEAVSGKLEELEDLFKGIKHLLLTSLCVHPRLQKKGHGTLLVNRCLEIADEAGLPVFLNSFPEAHSLYSGLGFEDLKHLDIDLNLWGTKSRGFGIYRTYAMVRHTKSGST